VVIEEYSLQVKSYQLLVENASDALPGWINAACWSLTFIILWLALVQAGILLQATSQIASHKPVPQLTGEG
ncbi:MAG: hypothetical protein ACM3H7_01150, partial [Acidobacteriaceae bacterium]